MQFSLLLFNEFQWNLAGAERVLCPLIILFVRSVRQMSRSQWDNTEKVVNEITQKRLSICEWHFILLIIAQYILSSNATISQDMLNSCSWMFRRRVRLMNLARSQFGLKADLPVGFPYRFNSSFIFYYWIDVGWHLSRTRCFNILDSHV